MNPVSSRRNRIVDERALKGRYHLAAWLGPVSSSFTLAWLASHRDRFRTLVLGGKHLTMLVIWDHQAGQTMHHTDDDVEAIRVLTYGPKGAR